MPKKTPTRREVKFEIFIKSTPAAVWRAITDPKKIATWSYMYRVEINQLAVGGRFLFFGTKTDSQPDVGIITKLVPEKRLVYEWHSNEPDSTTVDYTLKPEGPYTKLTFINSGFKSGKKWDGFYFEDFHGWVKYHLAMTKQLTKEGKTQ